MNSIQKRTEQRDSAVSPVVGVMLMLVVTIIIAAVVASFAGGLVTNTEKAPSAVLDVEIYSEHDIAGSMGALYKGYGYAPDFTITHLSGDPIETADTKLVFSWTNATTGQTYHTEYAGGEGEITYLNSSGGSQTVPGAFYANDGSIDAADVFGNVTLTTGMQMQTASNFLTIHWGTGTTAMNTGSPLMDVVFGEDIASDFTPAAQDGEYIYEGGVMELLPKGTAVSVQLVHIPSGNLIYDKVVYVQ